jgi:hypothetical protein
MHYLEDLIMAKERRTMKMISLIKPECLYIKALQQGHVCLKEGRERFSRRSGIPKPMMRVWSRLLKNLESLLLIVSMEKNGVKSKD